MPIDHSDPTTFEPGVRLRNAADGHVATIKARNDTDDGWLLEEGGGVGDKVYLAGLWHVDIAVPEGDDAEILDFGNVDDPAGMAQLLHDSNESRVGQLEQIAGQPGSLENAFDALKMIVLLEQICVSLEITDTAMLAFEGRRAEMLTGIEAKYQQMLAAKEAAERQARLGGGPTSRRGGVRMVPGPGGRMVPAE